MPEGLSAAVVAAKPTSAPKSPAEYQAEAMKLIAEAEPAAPKPEVTVPGEVPPAEPTLADAEKALAAEVKAEAESAELPPAEKPPERQNKGFDALVREKAALRKKEAEVDAKLKKHAALLEAAETGDPSALLRAAGVTHEQYTKHILGLPVGERKPPAAKPEPDNAVLAEVKRLNERLEAAERKAQQAELQGVFTSVAKEHAASLPFTAAMGMEGQAMQYLQQYFNETGEMPGATIEESVRMSLEAVESNLAQQAKAWEGVLTRTRKPGTVAGTVPAGNPKSAVQSAKSGQASAAKTLTSSLNAPAKPGADEDHEPRTAEEYQARALALLMSREGA